MEFGFTADDGAFRQEVRQFLHHNPPESFPKMAWMLATVLEPTPMRFCASWAHRAGYP